MRGNRIHDHAPVLVKAGHGGEQEGVSHIPGKIIDTDRDCIDDSRKRSKQHNQHRRAAQDADEQRNDSAIAMVGHSGHEGSGYAEKLGQHQPIGHGLLADTAIHADQEQISPHDPLGKEVSEHGEDGDQAKAAAEIYCVLFDLQVFFAGIRHVREAGPATGGEAGKENDNTLHADQVQGHGHGPQAQGSIGEYPHDEITEVAVRESGEANNCEGE